MNDELQQLKEEFEQRVKALEDKYNPKEEFPKCGDNHCYITISGKVNNADWANTTLDKKMLEFGNVFKTREEAEFLVEKLKVIKELKQLARPFTLGSKNYWIKFDRLDMDFIISSFHRHQPLYGDFYFDTEEEAKQAINIIGEERIKKYLFGVDD